MRKAVDDGGTSDLKFIMADCEVSLRAQYELVSNGVTSERKLINLEESKDKVREVLKTQFGMDGDASLPMRVQVSTILDAWESAKDFVKKENELRAEARSSHEPKEIQGPEQTMLRRAIQAIGGKRPDKEIPAEASKVQAIAQTVAAFDAALKPLCSDPEGNKLKILRESGKLEAELRDIRTKSPTLLQTSIA